MKRTLILAAAITCAALSLASQVVEASPHRLPAPRGGMAAVPCEAVTMTAAPSTNGRDTATAQDSISRKNTAAYTDEPSPVAEPDTVASRPEEALPSIEAARELKGQYKFDEATQMLASMLDQDMPDMRVLAELADCHFQSGDIDNAINAYDLLSTLYPGNLTFKVRLTALASRTRDYEGVIALGTDITRTDTIPAITAAVGDAYAQFGADSTAWEWYGLTIRKKPRNAQVVSKMATILLNRGDYDGILSLTDGYLAIDSANIAINSIKAKTLYLKKDYDASLALFRHIHEGLGDDSYHTHLYLGYNNLNLKLWFEAENELLKAWKRDSSDVSLALSVANAKAYLRPYAFKTDALPWYEKAEKLLSESKDNLFSVWYGEGKGLNSLNEPDFDGAIERYRKALEIKPDSQSCMLGLGNCYRRKKDYKTAKQWYERYLMRATPDSNGYKYATEELDYINQELFMLEGK